MFQPLLLDTRHCEKPYICLWFLQYTPYQTDEERLKFVPPRVVPDQWPVLVKYWGKIEIQEVAARNQKSRLSQVGLHTSGRKAFPQVRYEMKKRNQVHDRVAVYFATHEKKKKPADPTSEENKASMKNQISQAPEEIRDDLSFRESVFVDVMGPDRGRVRCMGIGLSPTQVFGSRYTSGPSSDEITNMIRDQVRKELSDQLREEIRSELYGEFEGQLKEQMSALEARLMQNFLSTLPLNGPAVVGDVPPHTAAHVEGQPINASSSTTERARDTNGVQLGLKVELYAVGGSKELVATGILISSNNRTVVDGEALGNGYYEVRIDKVTKPQYPLFRPNGQLKTIGHAENKSVAWPKYLVSFTN